VSSIDPDASSSATPPIPSAPDAVDRIKAAVELYGCGWPGVQEPVMFDDMTASACCAPFGELSAAGHIHLEYPIEYTSTLGGANYPWASGGTAARSRPWSVR